MSIHVNSLLLSERVLLLQGPMGDFFTHFAAWLKLNGIQSFKVNLNGGDQFYARDIEHTFDFTGSYADFSPWIDHLLITQEIDAVVCFGDCRKYHQMAKNVASKNKIKFFAFEEGYIRPNYITFEQDGVNFFSNFLTHLQFKDKKKKQDQSQHIFDVDNSYTSMVMSAITYYFFMFLMSWKYSHYKHHRQMSIWTEIYYWILGGIRRVKNACFEERKFDAFLDTYQGRYFVFALQVHNDFQIRTHSELKCMQKYIEIVVEDFAKHAEAHHHLVLKHHPMDRGYRHYGALIKKLEKKYAIEGRIHYFCDIHLPSLLKNSIGFVAVNSTTAIQALYHQIPVKVLGYALYNLPKLTNQRPLARFWKNPGKVDQVYFEKFRAELINYSQLNGSFYGLSPWMKDYNIHHVDVDVVAEMEAKSNVVS